MPLDLAMRSSISALLDTYCLKKVPFHLRSKRRLTYKWRASTVTLIEHQPDLFTPGGWVSISVAQFRYDAAKDGWTLYCADRNSRWHDYIDLASLLKFEVLLAEVDEDPTGIFWG